ncbi:uncharacterized protein LOC133385023 isoform X2 [Rhineura floridana]|uniref:uncharacterized protein LOC133385023 isoform X2 n=1 Tax=Rhineura floridana TaxID=261503 RepID=UPI002AC87F1C|nr:uncharacterized protein LOC133385023 isoform X2 [Rhineura floridana]
MPFWSVPRPQGTTAVILKLCALRVHREPKKFENHWTTVTRATNHLGFHRTVPEKVKYLPLLFAESEIDTEHTQNLKFFRCKCLTSCERTMSSSVDDGNNPNSVNARSIPFHSIANAKMGFPQPNNTRSGAKHSIQRLSRVNHPRVEQEASIAVEPTSRRCLSSTYISKLDNKLLESTSIPEIQKLKNVVSWSELLLDTSPVGDNIQETGKSTLEHDDDTVKGMVQNSCDKHTINKSADNFEVTLLHTHVLNHSLPSENNPENAKRWTAPVLLSSNTLSPSSNNLSPPQTAKHEREGRDTMVSTNILEECEVHDHMHSSIREASFQNAHIVHKLNDSCTVGSHKNETYFWAPLNDISDEELAHVKINSLKLQESKEHTSALNSATFFKPENIKLFNLSVLGGRLPLTKRSDSCEKWNPGTENLLEIKEYKCKDFMWTLKPENPSGTNDIREAADGNIPFDPELKKDAPRDRKSGFQPSKKPTDQRNEPKSEHILRMDKTLERKKYTREEQANSRSNGNDFNGEGREMELKSLMKDRAMQINSFCRSPLLKPSENSTCQVDSVCLNFSYKSTKLDGNSDCSLLDTLLQFSDDTVACKSDTVPRYMQGDIRENISEDVVKSVVGSQNDNEKFLVPRVKVDGHKKFGDDKFQFDSNHHNSVLAKYYFYVNCLSSSKRLQHENGNHLLSCQQRFGFSKEANISAVFHHKGGNLYEHEATDHTNNEVSCCEDQRTEIIKHQSHPKEESKTFFATSSPKPLSNLLLTNEKKMENSHTLQGKKISGAMKISTNVAGPKRCWKRSSIAWSSFTHGELKPRSQHVQRPAVTNERIRKGSSNSQSCPSSGCIPYRQANAHSISETTGSNKNQRKTSNDQNTRKSFLKNVNAWTESRQQHETAFKGYDDINMKRYSDTKCLPWLLLPDELWLCIFSLLTHKDISRVSQVCHHFYQLAGDESFWKAIQLTNCHCLNDDWLIHLGNRHPQRFTLDHCHDDSWKITDVGLRQFFQHCERSLKELNINSCSGPGFRGDRVLFHASAFCHNLSSVDISWTGATDSGLIALVKACISLQCLSANGSHITDDSITALIEKHGKSLKKLEIFGCYALTAKCLRSVAMKCPDLKILNIGRIHKITEDCLTQVINSLKKLTSINITGLNMVNDSAIHFIVKKCPELECLVLSSCSQVTDISLMEISTYLPTIRYLDVSGCKEVTDIGVQALAGSCQKLSYLDLSSTATSKRGVCLLASFCFRTLECVKLSFCKGISLDAIVKLCKNCKRLKILHLYGCCFVPDLESIEKINKNVEVCHDLPVPATKLQSE